MVVNTEPKFIKESIKGTVKDLTYDRFDKIIQMNLFRLEEDIGEVPRYK